MIYNTLVHGKLKIEQYVYSVSNKYCIVFFVGIDIMYYLFRSDPML
jgi:hypothetical protein